MRCVGGGGGARRGRRRKMARKKIDCTKWYLLDSNENCKLIGCQREMEPVSRLAENSSFPQRAKINHWPFISSVAINFLHQLFRYLPSPFIHPSDRKFDRELYAEILYHGMMNEENPMNYSSS